MLYIVATPIGNLGEISARAVEILKSVAVIAVEDTRHSGIMLNHFGIETPLCVYQKFNEEYCSERLVERLKNGEDVALISDAGMPIICDPGNILVNKCIANQVAYTVVSGACALINALILSGFSPSEFTFLGFLPDKNKLREQKITPYLHCPSTLILYSPVQSVKKDLQFLFERLGDRRACVAREISKKFEEVVHFYLSNIPDLTLKGEFAIIVEGYSKPKSEQNAIELVQSFIAQGKSEMEAIKLTAKEKGVAKSNIYAQIQIHKQKNDF